MNVLEALSRGPLRAEERDGRSIVLFRTLWRDAADGWAIASRAYARAMLTAGIDVRLDQWAPDEEPLDPAVAVELVGVDWRRPREWDAYVFSAALLDHARMRGPLQALLSERGPRAYYCVFERRHVEPALAAQLGQLDGVWVQCRMNRDVLRAAGCENVTLIPYPYFDDDPHLAIEPPRSARRFYNVGRFEPRKAPDNVIRAFMRAFRPGEAELTVKASPIAYTKEYPGPELVVFRELREPLVAKNGWTKSNWRESIRVVTGRLSAGEMVALHADNDVYVTASRGEGLELGAWAAKLASRRMIATESGGPQDFMGDDDVLVPSSGLIPADPRYEWGRGATYADYRLDDLVAAMQRVRGEPPRGGRWGSFGSHNATFVAGKLKKWVEGMVACAS